MKRTIFSILMFSLFLVTPSYAVNLSSGSWSTSFDNCNSTNSCLDFDNMEGSASLCGQSTTFTSQNNNPLGSGNAMRVVVGNGTNTYTYTGGFNWNPGQPEIWVRFYIKYELGFAWSGSGVHYDKILYFNTKAFASRGYSSPVFEFMNDNYLRLDPQTGDIFEDNNAGFQYMNGGKTGDGKWHCMEVHLKTNTAGQRNGVYEAWIDGNRVANHRNVNLGGENIYWFILYSNQNSPNNPGGCGQVFIDDVAIYTKNLPNVDKSGNPFIGPINWNGGATPPPTPEPVPEPPAPPTPNTDTPDAIPSTLLFEENFENTNLASRGWYDNTSPVFSTAEKASNSTRSVEFKFNSGATQPVNGGSMRKKFAASDSVYLSYYVKYSSNWVGSQRNYHPHEFYFLTTKSEDWSGLAYTPMTLYVEQNQLAPLIAFQDSVNIDSTRIGQNLTTVTERRALAGCNGDSDGYGNGDCYQAGGSYYNGKEWKASGTTITKNMWHKVEAYIKLNSITNGKAVADGVIQYWLDGQSIFDRRDVMLRTAQNADMKFNQLIIAPWIGDGSPTTQTFWIDNLILAASKSGDSGVSLTAPTGLHIVPAGQ